MCDWCSWIRKGDKIYYLTDDMIDARWPGADVRDKIGHSAIEEYFPDAKGGERFESPTTIPPMIALDVNKGHCDAMQKAGGWAGARYSNAGNINSPWWIAVKKIIKEVKKIKYFSNTDVICNNWKVFETRGDARYAAWDAAWDAARDFARYAAQDAAVDAAGDAALLVMCTVAFFYDPENRHYKYAQSRMDVWRRGYGLLCDIDGVLYVYKKP